MRVAEENLNTVSLTLKIMCKRVSTEGSWRKILSTIITVGMNIGVCLRISSRENATTFTEMKLNTITLTCIWTKNKIFNGEHVTHAEYCPYRWRRQLTTSLSLRCQSDSTCIFFSVFLVGLFGNYITCHHKHRLG